jgi:hypothetical protein
MTAHTQIVVVPTEIEDDVNYSVPRLDSHISALCAITASGKLFKHALIHRNKTLPADASATTFISRSYYYSTKSAFISGPIHEDYIKNEVIPRLQKNREKLPAERHRAAIIVDGLRAHLSHELQAILAFHGIEYYFLPPHSSHLLQPLDRHFFSIVKRTFRTHEMRKDLSPVTCQLEHVFNSVMSAKNVSTIVDSWRCAGIVPEISNGEVIGIHLEIKKIAEKLAKKFPTMLPQNPHSEGKTLPQLLIEFQ